MHWMILPFKRYFDFEGRSRRMEFWMFALMNTAIALVLAGPMIFSVISAAMDPAVLNGGDDALDEAMYQSLIGFGGVGLGLYGIYALAVLIPNIAVTVRRLHDRNMSGWWYLGFIIAGMLPFVGFLASLAFIVILFLPGNDGPNRFGPDPKNPYEEDVFA
ncbi:MAG: DUF805 domain-containing protein [Pseudomonadota bacterium]